MEQAIYYTLSTIAQTLAGALSVLVAVVLFNLSRIEDAIEVGKNIGFPDAESLKDKDRRSKLLPDYRVPAANAAFAWTVRPRLRRAVCVSLLDVGLCFVALPFTPRIAGSVWGTVIVLVLAVGLGLICLRLYWLLITALVWNEKGQ